MFVLTSANLVVKLALELEFSMFLICSSSMRSSILSFLVVVNWISKNLVINSNVLVSSFLPAVANLLQLFLWNDM